MKLPREKNCSACGAPFPCGPAPGKEKCWCDELPLVGPVGSADQDCLCPQCLRQAIGKLIHPGGAENPG